MHIQLKRFAENVKLFLVDHFHEENISQEVVAEASGVNQSTISRWLTLESGLDAPLWAVLAWREHPQLHPVAVALMDYLESQFGRHCGSRLPVFKLNGSLHDEILSLMAKLGKLSKDELTHPTLATIFENPDRIVSRKVMLKIIRATKHRQRKAKVQSQLIGFALGAKCMVI